MKRFKIMKLPLILFLLILVAQYESQAQNITLLAQQEDSLEVLLNHTSSLNDDKEKLLANETFKGLLKQTVYKEGAFDYEFQKLKMCKLKSPDNAFRLFNWNLAMEDGTYRYFTIVLFPGDKKKLPKIVELTEETEDPTNVDMKTLSENNWMGSLYYDIIPFKSGRKKNYILLGWDGNNEVTNKKIIDVLTINGSKLRFGASVFKGDKGLKRIIFEYGDDWSMSVHYDEHEKRIVFDHLSPLNTGLEGNPAFYGPDMTFDCYQLKKGKWLYQSDIEFKRERNSKDKNFNFPPTQEVVKPKR